jgi:hypothetical protein
MPTKRYKCVLAIYIPLTTEKGTVTCSLSQVSTEITAADSTTSQGAKYYAKLREKVKLQAMERKTAGISGQTVRAGHCQHKHVFSVHNPTAPRRFQCCCSRRKQLTMKAQLFSRISNIAL